MSVNKHRKCASCGKTGAEDMTVTYHRFPYPGTTNTTKALAWAKYCWPNKEWTVESLEALYTSNKILCGRHFNSNQFYDSNKQKLSRFAVPDSIEVEELLNQRENIFSQNVQQSSVAGPSRICNEFLQIQNIEVKPCTSASAQKTFVVVASSKDQQNEAINEIAPENPTTKVNQSQPKRSSKICFQILHALGVSKLSQLTAREIKLYNICRQKSREILRLRKKIKQLKRAS